LDILDPIVKKLPHAGFRGVSFEEANMQIFKTDWKTPAGRCLRLHAIDWERLRRFKWIPILAAFIWLLVAWIQIIVLPRGDFRGHWGMGQRLVHGIFIYKGGLDNVYPPFWALVHAPLSFLGLHLSQILVYPLAAISIVVLLRVVQKLSEAQLPLGSDALFWSTALAVLLSSLFLGRDLPEVGVNTALVAMSWSAVYLWSKERDIAGGTLLGMAAALKCTPLLFVAWFVLKRQWKMAASSLIALFIFTLLPILVTGPAEYVHMMKHWTGFVVQGISDPDPSRGPLGEEKVENLALRPALARYLMHLPYGHMGRPESIGDGKTERPPSPFYLQFFDLPPFWAGVTVRIIMGALLLGMCWLMRRRPSDRNSFEIVWECAAVSILILLFSPVTWVQHSVGIVPAVYLICRAGFAGWHFPRWTMWAMSGYVLFCCVMSRALFGRDFIKLANSYRVKTIGFLLLLAVVLACLRQASQSSTQKLPGPDRAGDTVPAV
jgi:alpha-1,2-mannosyltransferase